MQRVGLAAQVSERYAMCQRITILPVIVEPFHPIHELQAFALVVVTCSELDGDVVLVVRQFNTVALVQCLRERYTTIIGMTGQNLLLANEQLCQHNTRQRLRTLLRTLAYPVDAKQSAEDDATVLTGNDGTYVELV